MAYRSLLFVPGARPDRFQKAMDAGPDAVCIDLEDAVAEGNKAAARAAAFDFLKTPPAGADIGVRVNSLGGLNGLKDVVALVEGGARPAFVLLPKARTAHEVAQLRRLVEGTDASVWALMETPEALAEISVLCAAIGEGGGVMFGGADFSASIGSDMGWDALLLARASIAAAAGISGCDAMDVPPLDLRDVEGMVAETRRVKAMGFTGRACIHPTQVGPINDVFTPSPEEVAAAEDTLAAYESSKGVMLHEGRLVEKPILAAARRVLRLAARAEK